MATAAQKAELLEQAKAHYAADMLLKGTYGEFEADKFRGCSVGCHVHHINPGIDADDFEELHDKYRVVADYYGYPEWLARLQETIFEGLSSSESAKWHVQLAEVLAALPDDHDWQAALHRVHVAILRVACRTAGPSKDVIQRVIDLHETAARGEDVSAGMWSAAQSAARSLSSTATISAWFASSTSAESASYLAAEAAAEAAEAARWAPSVWSEAYQEMRDAILAAIPAT